MSEEVEALEAERANDRMYLLDVTLERPQRHVIGTVGGPGTELVVADQPEIARKLFVDRVGEDGSRPRTAVEMKYGRSLTSAIPVANAAPGDLDETFGRSQ